MLEPVGLSHSGFRLPGLHQDSRGVVVGSEAVLLLYSLERLVSALRLLSEETALGDLLPTLRVEEVKNALGGRGYLLAFRSGDSRILDRCARAATLCLGVLCIGNERHFVAYRDSRAPLGYDAAALSSEPGDYIIYTATATQSYGRVATLPLPALIGRLRLLPRPGGLAAALRRHDLDASATKGREGLDALWLLIPTGIAARAARFLWQRGIEAKAALPAVLPEPLEQNVRPVERPLDRPPAQSQTLLRLPHIDRAAALVELFAELPQVRVLQPLADHLAVELGHVHPLRLLAFERLFDKERRHLFLADSREPLTLPATPFLSAERLIQFRFLLGSEALASSSSTSLPLRKPPAVFGGAAGPLLRLPLQLRPEATASEVPAATLVPWAQARSLGRLLYLLPPPLLAELRAAPIDEGILIVGALQALPLGRLFYAAAERVLVPLGMAILPRLRGDLLRAQLAFFAGEAAQPTASGYVVFLPHAPPLALSNQLFMPLTSVLLERLRLDERITDAPPPLLDEATVVNDPLGFFWPLWGGPPVPRDDKLLDDPNRPQKEEP